MALIGIGETKWRILRRLALAGGSAPWDDVRSWNRRDMRNLEELIESGLLLTDGSGSVQLTEAGYAAEALGEIEV